MNHNAPLQNSSISFNTENNRFDFNTVTNDSVATIEYIAHVYTNVFYDNEDHGVWGGTQYVCEKGTFASTNFNTSYLIGKYATMQSGVDGTFLINSEALNSLQIIGESSSVTYSLGEYNDTTSTRAVIYDFCLKNSSGEVIGLQSFTAKIL